MENFDFSIYTTFIGMLIVFHFLGFLCIIMTALKTLFMLLRRKKERKDWIIIVASLFLTESTRKKVFKKQHWRPTLKEKDDPWLTIH